MARVMLVDDDRTMLSLLRTLLELDGFEVIEAPALGDILEVARRESPDVLLMDCILPEVDGLDLLQDIRRDERTRGMVVVMTSGMDYEERCMARGANAFLQKPYSPDRLFEVLRQQINQSSMG
jgi:DNA-binding response OmpR family regulator